MVFFDLGKDDLEIRISVINPGSSDEVAFMQGLMSSVDAGDAGSS